MRLTFIAMSLLIPFQVYAIEWRDIPELEEVFNRFGVEGTFVVYDVHSDKYFGYNRTRAETRFSPASTFKIANSLIGLSVGVVTSVDEIIPYRGPEEPLIKEWKKDMSLREAISLSNVPIYQEVARRIGLERMQANIIQMHYGNEQIGSSVDDFWLRGPLKISAIEQVRFLAALAKGQLPFPVPFQHSVRDITFVERGDNWELHAKTGWENAKGPGVGWWVGWVSKDQNVYAFAVNIDIKTEVDAKQRIPIGRAGLATLEILSRP